MTRETHALSPNLPRAPLVSEGQRFSFRRGRRLSFPTLDARTAGLSAVAEFEFSAVSSLSETFLRLRLLIPRREPNFWVSIWGIEGVYLRKESDGSGLIS